MSRPERMLKGRPDDHSKIGATTKPARKLRKPACAAPGAGRGHHGAEDEAVALVEERVGALKVQARHVLREQERLEVGRVVNRVRPGVGGEELVVVRHAAAHLEGARVVDGVAVGDLRVHVAEGRDEAGTRERAGRRQRAVEDGRRDRAARDGLREEVVRPRRAEEVGRERLDDRAARRDGDEARDRAAPRCSSRSRASASARPSCSSAGCRSSARSSG